MKKTLKIKFSQRLFLLFCDLGGARTLDPLIKSQLLYQLSYEVIFLYCDCKVTCFFWVDKIIGVIFL